MNAHDMLPSDSEPDACTCCACSSCSRNSPCNSRYCVRCYPAPLAIIIHEVEKPFSITGPGEYKTRDGRKAVVTEIINNRAFGRFESPLRSGCWSSQHWNLNGQEHKYTQIHLDLVSICTEPRKPIEGWVAIYPNGNYGRVWHTKTEAKDHAINNVVRIFKVREVTDD